MKSMGELFKKNPYEGHFKKVQNAASIDGQKVNAVHEIVNTYYKLKGIDGKPKKFYEGKNSYPKMAREAKRLLESCSGALDDALWCLDKMKYLADRKGFEWSISTCQKYDLRWSGTKL